MRALLMVSGSVLATASRMPHDQPATCDSASDTNPAESAGAAKPCRTQGHRCPQHACIECPQPLPEPTYHTFHQPAMLLLPAPTFNCPVTTAGPFLHPQSRGRHALLQLPAGLQAEQLSHICISSSSSMRLITYLREIAAAKRHTPHQR
jgi:hypothetical protein